MIYEAIIGLHNNTVEIDEIVLIEKLQSDGQLEQVGGKDGVMSLSSRIDTSAHASFWLDIVKQKSLLRKCIFVAYDILEERTAASSS